MRACFLGQNVTALGFGIAMLQTPPLPEPEPEKPLENPPRAPLTVEISETPPPAVAA